MDPEGMSVYQTGSRLPVTVAVAPPTSVLARQALQRAASPASTPTTTPVSQSRGPYEPHPRWVVTSHIPDGPPQDEPQHLVYEHGFSTATPSQHAHDPLDSYVPVGDATDGTPPSTNAPTSTVGIVVNPHAYASPGQAPAQGSGSPPENLVEWRNKFFDIRSHTFSLPKQQWDELWIWMDNIWTPRRLPYTKKDGVVHHEWRCRYHKKDPLPSSSTGKRKREIRKYYGCPARMTANMDPSTRSFTVSGHGRHNHTLADLDATKICNGVREWTSMHVQAGRQPKEIEALVNGGGTAGGVASTRQALDTAGGKLLNEKTIRNIARRWRWPAAKYNMRQDDLFKGLHIRHNTFPFAIQGAVAFHRDVCDVARVAPTVDDFHRLLDKRKAEKLTELDTGFDAAAAILGNDPTQAANQHWDHVLQLFKDRSYDALVHYFASYIKEEDALGVAPAPTAPPTSERPHLPPLSPSAADLT